MTRWVRFLRWVSPTDDAQPLVDGDKLIGRIDLTVDAKCPCGSQVSHILTLHSHADCPRCGRTYAIRSIEYFRQSPEQLPNAHVTVGYVVTRAALRKATALGGVH